MDHRRLCLRQLRHVSVSRQTTTTTRPVCLPLSMVSPLVSSYASSASLSNGCTSGVTHKKLSPRWSLLQRPRHGTRWHTGTARSSGQCRSYHRSTSGVRLHGADRLSSDGKARPHLTWGPRHQSRRLPPASGEATEWCLTLHSPLRQSLGCLSERAALAMTGVTYQVRARERFHAHELLVRV